MNTCGRERGDLTEERTVQEDLSSRGIGEGPGASRIYAIGVEEFRRSVLQEVQEVFQEFSQREMKEGLRCMDDMLHCSKRQFCVKAIIRAVEAAGMAFLKGDTERTLSILSDLQGDVHDTEGLCEADDCHNYALSMIGEIEDLFTVAHRIISRVQMIDTGDPLRNLKLDPEALTEALAPLTHPTRMAVLMNLEDGEMSFSELSRDLGLKTGHLQFHLRSLESGGYVRRGRTRGRYCISLKGKTAMDGLRRFATGLIEVG